MKPLGLFAMAITFAAFAAESTAGVSAPALPADQTAQTQSAGGDARATQATTTEPATGTAPVAAPTKDHALVKAAQDAKAKRKIGSTKTITNADVKRSKGKLLVLDPGKEAPAAKPAETQEKHVLSFKERTAAAERLESAQKQVDELQKELDRLEQRYYEENDANYRDDVIRKRFAQTKKQLDAARQELANARDAGNQPPKP